MQERRRSGDLFARSGWLLASMCMKRCWGNSGWVRFRMSALPNRGCGADRKGLAGGIDAGGGVW